MCIRDSYQFPVKYTVYDENDQKVDELSVTEWYNDCLLYTSARAAGQIVC